MNNLETGKFELLTTPLNIINGIDDLAPVQPPNYDNRITIDSVNWKTPARLFKSTPFETMPKVLQIILDTGEILDYNETTKAIVGIKTNKVRTEFIDELEICSFISYQKPEHKEKEHQEFKNEKEMFIHFLVSSKLLQHDYFDGITIANIKTIYNHITNKGYIIDYNDFLSGTLTDIDIKKDIILNSRAELKSLKQYIKTNMLPAPNFKRLKEYKNNDNVQFMSERAAGTPAKPFGKYYHKTDELKTGETIRFTNEYVDRQQLPPNLLRVEFTIKNKSHLASLKMPNKLMDVLNVVDNDQPLMNSILNKLQLRHLERPKKQNTTLLTTTNKKTNSTLEIVYKRYIIDSLEKGLTQIQIIDILKNDFINADFSKQKTYRNIEEIKEIFLELKDKNYIAKIIEKNENFNTILDQLNLPKY